MRCSAGLTIVWMLSLTLLLSEQECGQQIYFTQDSGGVLIRAAIVPREKFSLDTIESLFRAFADGPAVNRNLALLVVGTSPESLTRTLFHGSNSGDNNDERTRKDIRDLSLPVVPVARLLVIRGAALLQYRDSATYTERVVRGKRDPSIYLFGDSRYQLLHFALTEPGPALEPTEFFLTVFAKAHGKLTATTAKALTVELAKLAGVPHVTLQVRKSSYFPDEFRYPAVLPFQSELAIPNPVQAITEPRLTCSAGKDVEVRCSGLNFVP